MEKEGLSDYYDVCIYLPKVQSNANGKSALEKLDCQCCSSPMANCELDYMEWINLAPKQRQKMIDLYHNADPAKLCFLRPMPFYDRWERNYYM